MYNNTLQHVSLTEEENYDQCPNLIGLGALNPQRVAEVVRRREGSAQVWTISEDLPSLFLEGFPRITIN